jgi:protein TonB
MSDSGMPAGPRRRRELRLLVASLVASLGIHAVAGGLVPATKMEYVEPPAPIRVSLRIAPDDPATRADDGATLDRNELLAPAAGSERDIVPSELPAATVRRQAERVLVPAQQPPRPVPESVAAAPVPKAHRAATPRLRANPITSAIPVAPERPPRGDPPHAPAVLSVAMEPARNAIPAPTTPPRFRADYLSNPAPAYPRRARRDGIEGTVLLKVLVTATGAPGEVKVESSSGSDSLDRAALDAVRAWQFIPARRADAAVDAWIRVPVVFRLESG